MRSYDSDLSDSVLFELTDAGVAVITINRPERRNAIDRATAQAISDALDRVDADEVVRVAIITGAGGTFSAGMDLKALNATGERPIVDGRGQFGICRRPPLKPLIAAVEGHALGGGTEIALASDMIIAAEDATFGLPEVKLGLAPRQAERSGFHAGSPTGWRSSTSSPGARFRLGAHTSLAWSTISPSRARLSAMRCRSPRRSPPTPRWACGCPNK